MPRLNVIKDKEGRSLTSNDKILTRWSEYCRQLCEDPAAGNPLIEAPSVSEVSDMDLPPLCSEVQLAVEELKTGKATEYDDIHLIQVIYIDDIHLLAELIKKASEDAINALYNICVRIKETKT